MHGRQWQQACRTSAGIEIAKIILGASFCHLPFTEALKGLMLLSAEHPFPYCTAWTGGHWSSEGPNSSFCGALSSPPQLLAGSLGMPWWLALCLSWKSRAGCGEWSAVTGLGGMLAPTQKPVRGGPAAWLCLAFSSSLGSL